MALLMLPYGASTQTAPYQVLQDSLPYVGLGAMAQPISPSLGDTGSSALSLPFDLTLYGQTFSTVYVNANGLLTVGSAQAGLNFPASLMPSTVAPNGFIAALWDDWCVDAPGCAGPTNPGVGIFYDVDATPGRGRLRVEWRHVRRFSDTQRPSDVSFMLTWYEGAASQVELHYGPATTGLDFAGQPSQMQARIGLEGMMGQRGMWLGPCAGSVPCDRQNVASLQNTRIRLFSDGGRDVTLHSVSAPARGYPGLNLPVTAQLVNRHQGALGPLRWSAYVLAPSATSTQGAAPLFISAPTTLQGFETRALSVSLPLPDALPPGDYRVALLADAQGDLTESDETNNLALSPGTVRVEGRAPDFLVEDLNTQQNNLQAGQSFVVDYSVDNAGNERGDLQMQLYLSNNAVVSTSDLPLGPVVDLRLDAQQRTSAQLSVQMPMSVRSGAYYLGAIVDPASRVQELDETNNATRGPQTLLVASDTVQLTTESLPVAVVAQDYEVHLQAVGGQGAYHFELTEGTLPAGLRFEAATGVLRGMPLEAAAEDLSFRVRSGPVMDSRTLRLQVVAPQPELTLVQQALPEAILGQDYASQVYALGGTEPYTWVIEQGSLPSGLSLSAQGQIIGAPAQAGVYPLKVRVRDEAGDSAALDLTITVRPTPNLRIMTHNLPEAELGAGFLQPLWAFGGVEPLSWRAATVLPPGLIITPEGRIQGSPEQVGAYRFLVRVTDRLGNADSNQLTLQVRSTGRLFIKDEALPIAAPEEEFRGVLTAQGGSPPYVWQVVGVEGALPEGLSAASGQRSRLGEGPQDLVISGVFPRAGRWAFTAEVTDSRGRSDRRPFALVAQARPSPPPSDAAQGCICFDRAARSGEGINGLVAAGLFALTFIRRDRRSSSAEKQPRES